MAEELEQTPVLGLNKPAKGTFDWDVLVNANWDLLDKLGAGRLPFMTPLPMEHKLEGDDAVGWALQGSTLDGDEYVDAWTKLEAAQKRGTTETKTYKEETYTLLRDEVTGWTFVDKAMYDKGVEKLKNSLGFVLDYVEGKKRIILPYKECYWKFGPTPNVFSEESLPNIKGSFWVQGGIIQAASGAFYGDGSVGSRPHWDSGSSPVLRMDASRSSEVYKDDAEVNPFNSTVYLYYRVADTVASLNAISLDALMTELEDVKSRLDALETKGE